MKEVSDPGKELSCHPTQLWQEESEKPLKQSNLVGVLSTPTLNKVFLPL